MIYFERIKPYLNRRFILTGVAFLIMVYIGISTIGVITRNYQLQQQVDELEQEIEILTLENQELEYRITYYRTEAFAEKEARDKLGLKAPGEKVVIFPDRIPREIELPEDDANRQSLQSQAQSNFEQWMYFLFHRTPD